MGNYQKAEQYHMVALKMKLSCMGVMFYTRTLLFNSRFVELQDFLDSLDKSQLCPAVCNLGRFKVNLFTSDLEKAGGYFERYQKSRPLNVFSDSVYFGYYLKAIGKDVEANKILEDLTKSAISKLSDGDIKMGSFVLGEIYAITGDDDEALKHLTLALEEGLIMGFDDNIEINPIFENLRDKPELRQLLKRVADRKAAIRAEAEHLMENGELDL
jgi:tetratricopeptide (TPR) repeat protein